MYFGITVKALLSYCVAILCIALAPSAAADITSGEDAINIAGKQRMYTQRMLKDYVLAGLNIRKRKALDELNESIREFENNLAQLQTYANDDATRANLAEAARLWQDLKPRYQTSPNPGVAQTLQQDTDALLKACHQAVLSLQTHHATNPGRLVNIAGRQRMLSQRIAGLYGLQTWLNTDQYTALYEQAVAEFERSLSLLDAESANTPEIKAELQRAQRQYKRLLTTTGAGQEAVALVARSAEKMYTQMDNITNLYVSLEGK